VTVCQVVSDEAKALIARAEPSLGAHHSPDLFHVQHETVQSTSLRFDAARRFCARSVTVNSRRAA
jgi:hypothetical protein